MRVSLADVRSSLHLEIGGRVERLCPRFLQDKREENTTECRTRAEGGSQTWWLYVFQQPYQNGYRNRGRRNHPQQKDSEEYPISPNTGARLLFLSDQQPVVSPIRFPNHVEDVACYRYGANCGLEQHVGDHADQRYRFCAAPPRREHNKEGCDASH